MEITSGGTTGHLQMPATHLVKDVALKRLQAVDPVVVAWNGEGCRAIMLRQGRHPVAKP